MISQNKCHLYLKKDQKLNYSKAISIAAPHLMTVVQKKEVSLPSKIFLCKDYLKIS